MPVAGPGRCHTWPAARVSVPRVASGGDVGNVAVGVGQVGVADEVGAPAGQGVAEDPLAERGPFGDDGAEEVRRPVPAVG